MEYSTNDIAAARSLQFATWTFLLRSHWNKTKCLYIITRYLPFIFLATDLSMYFTPNENLGKCRALNNVSSVLGMLLFSCSDCISRSPVLIVLAAIVCTSFMQVAQSRELQGATRVQPVTSPSYHFFSFSCSNWNWRIDSSRLALGNEHNRITAPPEPLSGHFV
ncbi:uncharacterized protein F5147DRAFT_650073 [Suillus discolor]|uniref:Uncharacterized protein n=1 Tax=Suillus discolor TaxID=1912936 RepID=A0A9P7FCM6_9AGAM|nr:uncharacterized protein F5147DRAFT_650073 [Suillus discolor]KAG2114286.1 hypothetical protein F5147DRAFT_650073 [Suillus discolor]